MSSWQFSKGDEVEVTTGDDPSSATWYTATVLPPSAKNKNQVYVEYKTLNSYTKGSKPLREHINVANVRPVPPTELHQCFKVGENVDAFHKNGWRRGTVDAILENSRYLVQIYGLVEKIVIEQCDLRLNRKWEDGFWVPPLQEQRMYSEMEVKPRKFKLKIKFNKRTMQPMFSPGTMVEVGSDEEGYKGSWYAASIVGSIGNDKFLVEYLTLKSDDGTKPLVEEQNVQNIRPCPPKVSQVDHFRQLEDVDAWYNDGWWVGVVSKVLDGLKYVIYFSITNEEMVFEHADLRPHQDWIDDQWVTPSKENPSISVNSREPNMIKEWTSKKSGEPKFRTGMVVEVKSDVKGFEGSWFTALIVGSIKKNKYLVEYQTLKTDDETDLLQEVAEASHIRPCPPKIQMDRRFNLFEEVDAWYNDGWWTGRVSQVLYGVKYNVYFWTTNEVIEFEHNMLRPHQEWINGKWVLASKLGENGMAE